MWPPAYATDHGPLFDVCANRHKGNAESVAANPSAAHKRATHERILALMGTRRMTSKEIASEMGLPLNCLSGRLSEMVAMGMIRRTGDRRDGAAVLEVCR